MQEIMIFSTVLVPIITGLVQLVKNSVNIPKTTVPAVAFIVGLIVGLAAYPFSDLDVVLRLWAGALAGLGATGLFELGNNREGSTKE